MGCGKLEKTIGAFKSVVRECTLWTDLFVLIPGYIMILAKLQRLFGSRCSNEDAH
jgi:hypothetical protein